MFSLIQRGQLYTDSNGYPIEVRHCTDSQVLYKQIDGSRRKISIRTFNELFERLENREYRQIQAEIEQEANLKKLRVMRRG
ncbi:DUF4222 domain-containing protein [Escherichia coli]|uniref:DUF4222 domain-containing protein n=1 Tax=Escherichia coli TaxID=562 RepID=UPI002FCD3D09